MAGPAGIFAFGFLTMVFFVFKNYIHYNNYKKKIKAKSSELFKYGEPEEVFVYLMFLTAHFIRLDKVISKNEQKFVNSSLFNMLPPEVASSGKEIIENAYKYDTKSFIDVMDNRAKTVLSYSTKLNILHYIRRLCVVDKVFSEENELKNLAGRLGVSMIDYDEISKLSFNNKLKPENILQEHEMISEKKLKIAEYLIFNKFLGEVELGSSTKRTYGSDGSGMSTISSSKNPFGTVNIDKKKSDDLSNQSLHSLASDKLILSKELTKKINNIEKEIREKTFDERIDEFQDKRIKQQINILDKKLHLFLDILSQKMDPAELTYNKYKQSFERVYVMALENIKDVVSSQRIIESIDKEELQEELERLKKQGRKQHVKTRQERLRLFEEETNRLNEILLNNERAIQEMEEVTFEIGRLKGTKGEDQRAIKEAIQDLDEWTDKVKLYDKR